MVLGLAGCGAGQAPASPAPAIAPARAAIGAPDSPAAGEIVIGERVGLHSEILGEDRVLLVYRPATAAADTVYPVVYLLDGEAHFHHVTGLVQFLAQQGLMPPAIVVGLANIDRTRDFTPTRQEQFPTSGGADRFLSFLERELVPAIEARYPTARYRVLVGHSLGGLLAVHALNRKPDLFDAYIGISPSLAWASELMQRQAEALLAARPDLDRVLYTAVGNEPGEMMETNRSFAAMLRAKAPRTLRWRFEEMAAEDHGSIVHRAVYRGLELVFGDWAPPATVDSLAALEQHYKGLSARYRMPVKVPENLLNLFGYRLLAAGRRDEAVAAFRRNVELHPDSANVHDSLAEALEASGDLAGAVRSYETAVKNAALNRDPALDLYKSRLDRARSKVK